MSADGSDRALAGAMDYLMRVRAAPDDEALRREVEAWTRAHPDHDQAWDRVRRAWVMLGETPRAVRVGAALRRPRRTVAALAAAAAILAACVLPALAPVFGLHPSADHATGTAEIRRIALEDGSVVHLGPRSALRVEFSPQGRSVALLDGEAFFEVARDPARPFAVRVETLTAAALGTSFEVRRTGRALAVGVRSGVVEVRRDGMDAARLGAGDRLTVDRDADAVIRDHAPPTEIAGWREGALFFADATVAQVVEELGRYRPGWIVIADRALAEERVTGLYDPRDPDRALRALVRPAGGQVREITPLLRVLSRP